MLFDDAAQEKKSCRQKTNVAGVFLAGDANGETQFATVAAAEGASAAVEIHRELIDEGLLNISRAS